MNILIKELPDRFFELPAQKTNITGVFSVPDDQDIDEIKGLLIKASDPSTRYQDIRFSLAGAFSGRLVAHIHGDNIAVQVGDRVSGAYNLKLWSGSKFSIGSRTTSNSLEVWIQKNGHVSIGEDCLIAHDVHIQCGDMHGIFDIESKQQINLSKNEVNIDKHVWLGRSVTILKDVTIGAGSIVGLRSLVTQDIESRAMAVGSPARVVKKNVSWVRAETCNADDIRKTINFIS